MADRFFDPAALHAALDRRRRASGISWRELQRQAGIAGHSTPARLVAGQTLRADTLLRLMAWLGETDITPYVFVFRTATATASAPDEEAS
jgi:hypothetical protein